MAFASLNWKPDPRHLRQFGWVGLAAFPTLGIGWGIGRPAIMTTGIALGVLCGLLAWLRPQALRPMYLGMSLLAFPIGLVVGEAAMLLVFYGMFLPLGLCFRLLGRDALQRKFDRRAASYWQPKKQPDGPASYLRQW